MASRAAGAALASLVAVSTLAAAPALGQTAAAPGRDSFWIGAGLGVGSEDFGGQLNTSYQFGANLISFRVASTAGLFDDGFTRLRPAVRPSHSGRRRASPAGGGLGIAVVDAAGAAGLQRLP